MAAGTSFIGRGLWLSLQPQLDHTYHTSGQLLLAEALWLFTFRSSHLWLRGGVEETEVKELPTVVWGLRNMSLLILSNKKKKKSHSPLDGFWLFLAPISREGREGTGGRLSPVFVFLLVLSLSVGLGEDRVGLTWDRTSKLLWSRSLYADCVACVCRMGELSSSVWAGDLLFPA